MATQTLTWRAAVEIVCCELEEFAAHRNAGRSVLETGLAMGIGRATAAQYERTISTLLAALKTETVPGPARPETAEDGAPNTLKGVTAP